MCKVALYCEYQWISQHGSFTGKEKDKGKRGTFFGSVTNATWEIVDAINFEF
jgi:hypothetical protein